MPRASRVAILATLVTALLAGIGLAHAAPVRRIPTLFVPRPIPDRPGSPWDELERMERSLDFAAPESLAAATIRSLESQSRPDSLDLSRALLYYGNSRLQRRIFADSRGFDAIERAIGIRARHASAPDPLIIWAHEKVAQFYPEAGSPQRGLAHAEEGLRLLLATMPRDTSMMAQAHLSLAASLAALGRDAEAGPHYERSLFLRERADSGESRLLVPMLAETGGYLSRVGEPDRAREMLQRAVRIASRDSGGSDFYINALARLSSFENRMGNVAESVDLAWKAAEVAKRESESSVLYLRARTVLAYRLEDFGDMAGSIPILRDLVPRLEASVGASNPQTLNARLALLQALVDTGDTTTAVRELRAAYPVLARQNPATNNNRVYGLEVSSQIERLRGAPARARDTLEVALGLERMYPDAFGARRAELLTYLLDLLGAADRSRVLEVGEWVDRLRDTTHVRSTPAWAELVIARARAEARAGLHDSAWVHALAAEERSRQRLTFQVEALPDLRGLQLAQQLGRPCELLTAIARPGNPGEVATAWDRVLRWRGLVRSEIARRRAPAGAAGDTAVAAAHTAWLRSQRRLAQLVVSGAAHPDDPESAKQFADASHESEAAERRYLRAASRFVPEAAEPRLEAVLARLGPRQALAAFATSSTGEGDPVLGAFVASGATRAPRWVALGSVTEITREVRAWTRSLSRPPAASGMPAAERESRRLGQVVRARLWDPILAAAGSASELDLIAEGVATEVPWLALPGARASYVADAPLAVRLLAAERDLLPDPDAAAVGHGLLAVGGPDFGPGAGAATLRGARETLRSSLSPCVAVSNLALPELPAAREEARSIAALWPADSGAAQVLIGAAATEASLKTNAPGKAVIHVATHGVMVGDSCREAALAGTRGIGGVETVGARRSKKAPASATPSAPEARPNPWLGRQVWLALAGANRPSADAAAEDGLLTAEEVATLDLRGAECVVLSACHSGVAESWAHEGVLGMRRAFHLAGARAVVASAWAVGDESAREWMTQFYAARARGIGAGPAVGEASRAVLTERRARGRSTHPFFWAAFTATED